MWMSHPTKSLLISQSIIFRNVGISSDTSDTSEAKRACSCCVDRVQGTNSSWGQKEGVKENVLGQIVSAKKTQERRESWKGWHIGWQTLYIQPWQNDSKSNVDLLHCHAGVALGFLDNFLTHVPHSLQTLLWQLLDSIMIVQWTVYSFYFYYLSLNRLITLLVCLK